MIEVTDFFFQIMGSLWSMIVQSWLLSMSVLIIILGWIIGLVNGSRQD